MSTIIDSFLVALNLDSTRFERNLEQATDKAKDSFKEMAKGALEFFGLMATAGAMVEFVKGQLEAEVAAGRLAKTLNVDVEELEALEGAVKRVGGSVEGMDSSLKGLNSRLAMIAIHGPRSKMALQIFAGLGISEVALKGKDATQVMGLLAEKMEHMSGAKAMALGERLGLDEGTVRLLQKGKEGMEALTAAVKKNVASAEQVEAAEKFEQTMLDIKGAFAAAGRQVLVSVMPALQAMGEAFAKVAVWVREHGPVVKAALIGIGVAFLAIGINALIMGAQAAFAWLLALGPIDLIIIAIAAVAAGVAWVYLEFKKWTEGGQSMLSGFFSFFKGIWEAIGGTVMSVIGIMKDIIMSFFDVFIDYWNLVVGVFTGNGDKIKESFKKLCKDLGHFFSEVALLIVYELLRAFFAIEGAGAKMWKAMKQAAMDALGWIADKLGKIANVVLRVTTLGQLGVEGGKMAYTPGGFAGMALHPAAGGGGSTSTRTSQTHIGTIQIQTQATDAKGIAAELPGAMKSHGLVDQADGGF